MFSSVLQISSAQRDTTITSLVLQLDWKLRFYKSQTELYLPSKEMELLSDFNSTLDYMRRYTYRSMVSNNGFVDFVAYYQDQTHGRNFIGYVCNFITDTDGCELQLRWNSSTFSTDDLNTLYFYYANGKDEYLKPHFDHITSTVPFDTVDGDFLDMIVYFANGAERKWSPPLLWTCIPWSETQLQCILLIGYFTLLWRDDAPRDKTGFKMLTWTGLNDKRLGEELLMLTKQFTGAVAFIYDRQYDAVVGCSDPNSPVTYIEGMDLSTARLRKMEEMQNPLIPLVFRAIEEKYGKGLKDLDKVETLTSFNFYSSELKDGVFVDLKQFKDPDGLDWVVIYCIPEATYIGALLLWGILTLVFALIAIAIGNIIAVISAFVIVKPLNALIREMVMVEDMRLDEVNTHKRTSTLKEVSAIQRTFYIMVGKLKEYRTFLPSHILARDYGEVENAADQHGHSASMGATRSHRNSLSTSIVGISQFSIGLEQREVTILVVRIENIEQLFATYSPKDFVDVHGKILEEVMSIARRSKGDLFKFEHGQFVVTWNASVHCTSHQKRASEACIVLRDSVNKLMDRLANDELMSTAFHLSYTITSDSAYTGNIGNHSKRVYHLFGSVLDKNQEIALLHREWKSCIIIDEKVETSIRKDFETRPIPKLSMLKGYEKAVSPLSCHDLVDMKKKLQGDEWMYEMKHLESLKRLDVFRNGYAAFCEAKFSEAKEIFKEYLSVAPTDAMARRLHSLCEEQLQHRSL